LLARIAGLIASRRQLRAALVEAARRAPVEERVPPLVQKVRDAVLAHLDDSDFGVGELAETLGMERTTLFKHLKALDQPPPVKLMRDIRLDAAARMLREAAGQVTEVAYACGYQSLSHFSKAFSEKFGASPSEFAQRARGRNPA
jgi:transcriptional regulator GlxA family with amidase domain